MMENLLTYLCLTQPQWVNRKRCVSDIYKSVFVLGNSISKLKGTPQLKKVEYDKISSPNLLVNIWILTPTTCLDDSTVSTHKPYVSKGQSLQIACNNWSNQLLLRQRCLRIAGRNEQLKATIATIIKYHKSNNETISSEVNEKCPTIA